MFMKRQYKSKDVISYEMVYHVVDPKRVMYKCTNLCIDDDVQACVKLMVMVVFYAYALYYANEMSKKRERNGKFINGI